MEEVEAAVLIRKARKQYLNDGTLILNDLDMTVMKGTIYGLLGASGCGKTTLLNSILGTRTIQSGMISVLGQHPDQMDVKSIGYMPQDVALVGEFTVKGALQHFGWIFGMTDEQIDERFRFLQQLLELPHSEKLVKNLSGGQQRRISLAVVLVHDPKLLILDEPTVGLDPVLRQNIWDYLIYITEREKKTVIITTHYIEEANQAHQIGLMRNGKILEEGNPETLLSKYNCCTIENVFVFLSSKQQDGSLVNVTENYRHCSLAAETHLQNMTVMNDNTVSRYSAWDRLCFTNKGHAKALMSKNFLRFKRQPGTLFFAFFFPVLQICVFFLAIGKPPSDLKIGVVNEELGNYTDCFHYQMDNRLGGRILEDNETCIYKGLGCQFIHSLGGNIQTKVYFRTVEEALEAAKYGKIHNFVHFPRNFSETVTIIRNGTLEFTDEDLNFQEINIYRDVIDKSLSEIIIKEYYEAYKKYAEILASDCNTNPKAESVPMKFFEPIYGDENMTYRDFVAPGMIALISVFITMGISTSSITTERTAGIWERVVVAGVTPTEILIFHIITLCCISVIQILELIIVAFNIFHLECKGDKMTVFLLIYIQSIVGICFGMCISVITKNVTEANHASLGLFYPLITLTGCFWPLEAMPTCLKYISYFVPLTITTQSLANVIHRGWGLEHFHVYKSFLASIGFIFSFVLVSIIILRNEKKR